MKSVGKQYMCIMQKSNKFFTGKKIRKDLPTYSWECKFMSIFTTYPLPISHTKWLIIYTFCLYMLKKQRGKICGNLFSKIWKLNPFYSYSPHRNHRQSLWNSQSIQLLNPSKTLSRWKRKFFILFNPPSCMQKSSSLWSPSRIYCLFMTIRPERISFSEGRIEQNWWRKFW